MNPLMVEAAGSILRALLNIGAGWLVVHGVWEQGAAQQYVGALALALVSIGWSVWQKWRMRSKLLTALSMPAGASERAVEAAVADPMLRTPPVTLPKHVSPGPLVPVWPEDSQPDASESDSD